MKSETYEEFVEKFKPKKTTDDCYTPPIVYEAVADWVANEYGLDKACFVRPFYPGGDYENYDYSGAVVVDNPPFSILSQITKFYTERGIKFFLFSPILTGMMRYSNICTALCVGVDIEYENGAVVSTGFITNLEPDEIRMRTAPSLYKAVKNANDENRKSQKSSPPKYVYPLEVVSAAGIYPYNKYDIDFVIPRDESVRISQLDAQSKSGKKIFGCGLLISERLKAEREKAEKAEREKAEKAERWDLSEREIAIIKQLNNANNRYLC